METENTLTTEAAHIPRGFGALPNGWRWSSLGAACAGVFDCPHSTPKLTDEGPFVVRTQDITSGTLRLESTARVSLSTYAERIKRAEPRHGDLLYSREGTYFGIAAEVPKGIQVCLGQRMVLIRPDANVVHYRFLRYWLNSPTMSAYIHGFRDGSVAERLNLTTIRALPTLLPPIPQQMAIAGVLGALDDKIAVNERIAATADSLRSAHYLAAHTEAPGEFSEEPLSTAAEFINGRAFTKDATGKGRMVVRIAEIKSGPGGSTVYNDIQVPDKHLARPGDVLFAWSGSLTVARWFHPEAIVNQHIFKVVPRDDRPMWLVAELLRLKLDDFRAIAADKATTMGHIQRRHLDEPVLTPNAAMTQKLDAQIGPLWDRALAAEQESLKLANLRDALLPQLMSGKLRVRDAEKIVEDAV